MKKSIYTAPEIFVTEIEGSLNILNDSDRYMDGGYMGDSDANNGSFDEDETFFNSNTSLWDE